LRAGWQDDPVTTTPSSPDAPEYRIERDTMGEVRVPVAALWRAQTQRAVENFPISGRGLEPAHIRALATIKAAAAEVNAELGVISAELASTVSTTTSSRSTRSRPARAPRRT
jgi:fumarate hydratase class II